jgi:hypothetical protein
MIVFTSLLWMELYTPSKVYEYIIWKATGRWFSPDPPVSSTNKTDRHDIAELLLKMVLNTIKQTNKYTDTICFRLLEAVCDNLEWLVIHWQTRYHSGLLLFVQWSHIVPFVYIAVYYCNRCIFILCIHIPLMEYKVPSIIKNVTPLYKKK